MRLSRQRIRARVKGELPIEFTDEPLTSYSGLELFRVYLDRFSWAERLKAVFADRGFDSDYGSFRIALVVVGILSITFSLLTIWRRSIIPAIVTHTLFDFSQFVGLYYLMGDASS